MFEDLLKRPHIPLCDVERALREVDCDQSDIPYAFQEADGQISILKDLGDAEPHKGEASASANGPDSQPKL